MCEITTCTGNNFNQLITEMLFSPVIRQYTFYKITAKYILLINQQGTKTTLWNCSRFSFGSPNTSQVLTWRLTSYERSDVFYANPTNSYNLTCFSSFTFCLRAFNLFFFSFCIFYFHCC